MADETFEQVTSGASLTFPQQASALRKNGFVLLKGFPCKIVDMSTSKTGKHGHAKISITGVDIFTGKKYEDITPSTHNMDVPHVSRLDYQLIDISAEGEKAPVSLLTENGETKDDLNLPDDAELAAQIREAFDDGKNVIVSVLAAMGIEQIISWKEDTKA